MSLCRDPKGCVGATAFCTWIGGSRQHSGCMPPADFDVAAVQFVEGLVEELQKQGLQLALANPSHQVRGVAEEGSWGCSN